MIGDVIHISPIAITNVIMYYEGRVSGDLYFVKKQFNYSSPIVITPSIMLLKGELVAISTLLKRPLLKISVYKVCKCT